MKIICFEFTKNRLPETYEKSGIIRKVLTPRKNILVTGLQKEFLCPTEKNQKIRKQISIHEKFGGQIS